MLKTHLFSLFRSIVCPIASVTNHKARLAFYLLPFTFCLLTACDSILPPAVDPTTERTLTGPTIAASETLGFEQPTDIPFDEPDYGQNDPTAAALAPGAALPPLAVGTAPASQSNLPVSVEITAMDGSMLQGDLFQGGANRLPGILLLSETLDDWGNFPVKLHDAGFTVLVMGLRDGALLDFPVMMQALSSGEADPASLAVVGAGGGADLALLGCAGDMLCDTVVLLSPSGDSALPNAMSAYNPRSLMLVASEDDSIAYPAIQALQAAASGEVLFQPFASAGSGGQMLTNRPDLGDLIISWLTRQIGRPPGT